MLQPFPFSAILGQERLKAALLVAAVNPRQGGVLLRGEKGTAKTVSARALPTLLPEVECVEGSSYNCAPTGWLCPDSQVQLSRGPLASLRRSPPLVEVPAGVTLERLVGSLDPQIGRRYGLAGLEPGLVARAHRGVLCVERVNLLPSPILDAILTIHEEGLNRVESRGVVVSHPCEFLLVASMSPDEGDLQPHFLDRFALSVLLDRIREPGPRADILHRCLEYERDPATFRRFFQAEETRLARKIESAREMLAEVTYNREMLEVAVSIAASVESPGHRANLALLKAACALAALEELTEVGPPHIQSAASLVLPHRMRTGQDEGALSEAFRRDYFTPAG